MRNMNTLKFRFERIFYINVSYSMVGKRTFMLVLQQTIWDSYEKQNSFIFIDFL